MASDIGNFTNLSAGLELLGAILLRKKRESAKIRKKKGETKKMFPSSISTNAFSPLLSN